MYYKFIIALAFLAIGCRQPQPAPSSENVQLADDMQKLLKNHSVTQAITDDSLGTLILSIDCRVNAKEEDRTTFQNGIVPWISLEHANVEMSRLINPDEIVLPFKKASLVVDYPLNKPAIFPLSSSGKGFTRKELVKYISDKYQMIYKEEETSATQKTVAVDEREWLINRNQTDGKYGIWGHDLSDLVLSGINAYKSPTGEVFLILALES